MQTLPPVKWQQYLERISERYAGQLVTLRQQEETRDEAQVVLWRTPLRRLAAETDAGGTKIAVVAGYEDALIEIRIGPVESLRVALAPNQSLEQLTIRNHDGTRATLLFNVEG